MRRLAGLGFAFAMIAAPQAAVAQYPEQPIKIIFPNSPGGAYHTYLLAIEQELKAKVPQPVVSTTMPGAGTVLGTRYVIEEPADGYTLLFIHEAALLTSAMGQLGYDVMDKLQPIARVTSSCTALAARADAPFSTLGELSEYGKANPEAVRAAIAIGALSHLDALILADALDINIRLVQSGAGGGDAQQALLAGDADLAFLSPVSFAGLVQAGQLKPVVYWGSERDPKIPNAPTPMDSGYTQLPLMCTTGYFWIRRDAPDEAKAYWSDLLETSFTDPAFVGRLEETLGIDIVHVGGEELATELQQVTGVIQGLVDEHNLRSN